MSEPSTCRIQTVRCGQVVRIRATGNWCVQLLTVEQEYLLLGTDVKHSEVQYFVLITQRAASKYAFPKRRLDRLRV